MTPVTTGAPPANPDTVTNVQNVGFYGILQGVLMDTSQFSTTGTVTLSGGQGDNTFKAGSSTTVMIGGPEDNTFYDGTGTDTITGTRPARTPSSRRTTRT